ncbi:MAG TPA: hypothetical protein VK009_13390 [Chloroflexota bacterium]|nr:hypothetical protein [Chloroflexota bacterium]
MIAEPVEVYRHDMAVVRDHMVEARTSLLRQPAGLPYWVVLAITGALTVCAAAALAYRLTTSTQLVDWGYAAATAAFLVSSVQAAPALAAITRLTRGHWAVSLHRIADLMALGGLVTVPLVLILLYQLPQWKGRPSIWFDLVTAPQAPDAGAIVLLAFAGLAILWLSAAPVRAGTPKSWEAVQLGLVLLGSLYIALLVYVDMLVISDLGVSLVNGWHSSDMPVYQAFTGFEGALASVIVALACLRRFGGLRAYIKEDVFKALSKLLLAFALLFIWFFWAEFLTFWYGRLPDEKDLMTLFMFGSYLVPFSIAIFCNFLVPAAILIWNSARASVAATTAVAVVVLIGNFADRVRLYVPSWSLAGPIADHFGAQPPTRLPDVADLLIVFGCPAAVLFLILLALRFLPPIAIWEHQRDLLLRFERPFAKAIMPVVAKVD